MLDAVVRHPLQLGALRTVSELPHDLRSCEDANDYNDFQKLLFQHVWQAELGRGKVRRSWKRLKKRLPPTADTPELPPGRDPWDETSWRLEDLTHERVLRQLRSVGDALAWRVCGFDRGYVLALSRNAPAAPMAGKEGLGWELGTVDEIWRARGHFTLLHDLTSCLRIGDLTEFATDGQRLLHEVKKGSSRDRQQVQRMKAAVRAVNNGEPLPGTAEQLVRVETPYRAHLALLRDAITLADLEGTIGMKVPGGRALVATIVTCMSRRFDDPQQGVRAMDRARVGAIRRARIADHRHHVNMRSADWAARSATSVPYGIYPLSPEHAASLICDFTVVEVVLSADALCAAAEARGMSPQRLLPEAHGELRPGQPMFRFALGDRAVILHAGVASQLLIELVSLDAFLDGLAELLTRECVPGSPMMLLAGEASVWN